MSKFGVLFLESQNCIFLFAQDLLAILMQSFTKMFILALNHQWRHQTCSAGITFDFVHELLIHSSQVQ
jgi:hypothetical protein